MGRKKVNAEVKVDVRLRMDLELARRIQEAAVREGNSVAAFIRAAVVEKLDRLVEGGGKKRRGRK